MKDGGHDAGLRKQIKGFLQLFRNKNCLVYRMFTLIVVGFGLRGTNPGWDVLIPAGAQYSTSLVYIPREQP